MVEEIAPGFSTLFYVTSVIVILMVVRWAWPDNWIFSRIGEIVIGSLPAVTVDGLEQPFVILLREQGFGQDWENGFEFDIRCKVSTKLYFCWGVETSLLSRLTTGEGIFTTSYSSIGDLISGSSERVTGPIAIKSGDSHRLIALPDRDFCLGAPPRKQVPLVLLTTAEEHGTAEARDIVTMLTMVHIKDDFCTESTNKINEVVCLRNGHWMSLASYYRGSSLPERCVLCREVEVSMLLLPCRHVCVCDLCYEAAGETCPMCGGTVENFVLL